MVETNSLVSKTIDVRREVDASSVRRDCFGLTTESVTISSSYMCPFRTYSMVVRQHEDDVGKKSHHPDKIV